MDIDNLTIESAPENLLNQGEFVTHCKTCLRRLADKAPSDSHLTMKIHHEGNGYTVDLRLASNLLNFEEITNARSPFMAVEKALKEAFDRVQTWSAAKEVPA